MFSGDDVIAWETTVAASDPEADETARMLAALSDVARTSTNQKRHFLTYLIKVAMVELIAPLAGPNSPTGEVPRRFQS